MGTTFSLVRYNNPVVIDKEEIITRPKSAPASTGTGAESQDETQEILDSILPPREWEEDGKLWRQSVSSTPATRLDVMNLQEQLDLKLQQRQARETGICQVEGRTLRKKRYSVKLCFKRSGENYTPNASMSSSVSQQ